MSTLLDNALSIDIFVLVNLLRRNRCAHGRTQYFQRTSMVVRALQRCNVQSIRKRTRAVQASLDGWQRQQKRKRRKEQEEWTLDEPNMQSTEIDAIKEELSELKEIAMKDLPEIVSRIHHASNALVVEIARGFFLPLCTVAMAALARIRVLVMRLGREALTELQSCWSALPDSNTPKLDCEGAMEAFVEVNTDARLAQMQKSPTIEENLKCLGLQPSTVAITTKTLKDSETESEVKNDDESGYNGKYEGKSIDAETMRMPDQEDDMGISVDFGDVANDGRLNEPGKDEAESSQTPTDFNMDLVRKVQAKKTTDRDMTPKKKRKEGKQSGKKKKKRRKKDSKKKDTFDEIFGDL